MISFIHAASMKEPSQILQKLDQKRWIVVKTANAQKKVMMAKIVVKKVMPKWIAARTANAPRKDITARTAVKNHD